jgi:glutamate dehydrogenase (NAD(P)+)
MAWVHDEIGRAVGLPRELGGIPLDELGATGFGLRHSAEVALASLGRQLAGARVVVQGFGSVGIHAARLLVEQGAVLVAASDSTGAIADPAGLDVAALVELKCSGKSVAEHRAGTRIAPDELVAVECEMWIPAARPDVIRAENAPRLRAKLVIAGANIPLTDDAERSLHARGVVCVPDFIANAGGVICAAMEWRGSTQAAAFDAIAERIRANTAAVLEAASRQRVMPRQAAVELARERVRSAMGTRRWSIF